MEGRILTADIIDDFRKNLELQEKSTATIEKYIRDESVFGLCTRRGHYKRNCYRLQKSFAGKLRCPQCELNACKHQQPVCIFELV